MTRSKFELQIAEQNQKEIAEMKNAIASCFKSIEIIDTNTKKSHMSLLQDITNITLRINFLVDEIKKRMTKDELKELEERFKKFALNERNKMQVKINEAVKASEEKINVVQ